jgi:UDP-N-acetylmuramate--alanine ligase
LLINKFGLKRTADLRAERILSYSLQNESADAYAKDIVMKNGSYEFDVVIKDKNLENILLHMGGCTT